MHPKRGEIIDKYKAFIYFKLPSQCKAYLHFISGPKINIKYKMIRLFVTEMNLENYENGNGEHEMNFATSIILVSQEKMGHHITVSISFHHWKKIPYIA